jgi:DNA invertase Pin-like site-specific DNA recombinase
MKHIATNQNTAIAYIRVSTTEQELGPEAQKAAIERWAKAQGVTVASWHVDQGVSGGAELDARPGLTAAFDSLRDLGAGLLVVAKRDRLARDVMISAMMERLAQKAGARIVSAAGEGDGKDDDPSSLLMRRIIDVFAEYERALIRSRTKSALAVKKARGERVGNVPFGYRLSEDNASLVARDDEQAVIGRIRELRHQGVSVRGIVAKLDAEGVVGRRGRALCKSAVENVLRTGA